MSDEAKVDVGASLGVGGLWKGRSGTPFRRREEDVSGRQVCPPVPPRSVTLNEVESGVVLTHSGTEDGARGRGRGRGPRTGVAGGGQGTGTGTGVGTGFGANRREYQKGTKVKTTLSLGKSGCHSRGVPLLSLVSRRPYESRVLSVPLRSGCRVVSP